MLLNKLKTWGVAILAIVASILYALLKSSRAKNAREKLKGIQDTLKVERAANKSMSAGLNKEAKVRNEKIDTDNRDHFS